MDLMEVRRGLLASMSGKPRMASGEFVHTSGVAYINHNLGTKKIFIVLQRVETDHSNIDSSNQFQSVMIFGATAEALQLDTDQTYSISGGNQAHFDYSSADENGSYPKGVNSYFPAANGAYPTNGVMAYPMRGITAEDALGASDNTVRVYPVYGLTAGRWVWRAYALD